jgi:signal transduction histidine kinase
MDSTLQWKPHTDSLLIKLHAACYATLILNMTQQILVMVHFSYFHSIISYGIIFWGASPQSINTHTKHIQITNASKKESCRKLLSNHKILTL